MISTHESLQKGKRRPSRRKPGRPPLSKEPTESRQLPLPLSEWGAYDEVAEKLSRATGRRHTAQDVVRRYLRIVHGMSHEEYEAHIERLTLKQCRVG